MPAWTSEGLREWVRDQFAGAQILVLANREPYSHVRTPHRTVDVRHSTSGLVSALEPLLRASGGVWIAHGSGSADLDTVVDRDGLLVPADAPSYRLRRVWLDADELRAWTDPEPAASTSTPGRS